MLRSPRSFFTVPTRHQGFLKICFRDVCMSIMNPHADVSPQLQKYLDCLHQRRHRLLLPLVVPLSSNKNTRRRAVETNSEHKFEEIIRSSGDFALFPYYINFVEFWKQIRWLPLLS